MADPTEQVFSGANPGEIHASYNRIVVTLPIDVRQRLNAIRTSYLVAYGFDEMCERMSGRTVAQVLDEFKQPDMPTVVAESAVDDLRYTLYDAPTKNEITPDEQQ